jgi:hypothetical protein
MNPLSLFNRLPPRKPVVPGRDADHRALHPMQRDHRATWQINGRFFVALSCAFAAYKLWPDSAYWWQLYPLAIIIGLCGAVNFIDALKLIWSTYKRDKRIEVFMKRGSAPKSARLPDDHDLRQKDMIDE